jgi:hypothetical protein
MLSKMAGVAACALALALAHHEAKADGGASAAVAAWAGKRVIANSEGIKDEPTVAGKVIKPTGVSIQAIEEHGLAGGPNSVMRKPLGKMFKHL